MPWFAVTILTHPRLCDCLPRKYQEYAPSMAENWRTRAFWSRLRPADRAQHQAQGSLWHSYHRFAGSLVSALIDGRANNPMHDAAPPRDLAIEFRNVAYRLENGRELLCDLNLQVRRGETLVLLGRSGSGKTTTLKLINRLLDASGGDLLVEGKPVRGWDVIRLRRMIGYVIQEVGLFPHFTVERNIGLVHSIDNWPPERVRKRVQELLKVVGLDPEVASRHPRELSGGQRQRVGVARALAADPPI